MRARSMLSLNRSFECNIYSLPKTIEFSSVLSNAVAMTVRVQINTINFILIEDDIQTFEIRITVCVSVTRIDNTLSYSFLQTDTDRVSRNVTS